MKVVSFNANGIRARFHQLEALKATLDPDVIGIQEIKVQDVDFPIKAIEEIGYHASFYGQKGHYGVAFLSKRPPLEIQYGFPSDPEDAQRRLITGVFEADSGEKISLINGYFPQGESRDHPQKFPCKTQFYIDLLEYLNTQFKPTDKLAVIGDMNIAPLDADIGIGPDNAKRWLRTGKCSFLPEEREWLQTITDWGLEDTYRRFFPDVDDRFSWFDYRSKGFNRDPKRGMRIDMVLATKALSESCVDVGISYDIRGMEKPSDHCPIWATFDI